MSSLVLFGDTSGSISLTANAIAGSNILTVPALTGTLLTTASTGTVLQVVQTYYKALVTTTSATWTATSITADITPKSTSNKILVMVSIAASGATDSYGGFRLYRNGSEVTGATSNQSPGTPPNTFIAYTQRSGDSPYQLQTYTQNYLDSPSNTSAQTYTIYWAKTYGTSICLNGTSFVDSGNTYTNYAPSSITLMEVAV